jgi:hypothetical protein
MALVEIAVDKVFGGNKRKGEEALADQRRAHVKAEAEKYIHTHSPEQRLSLGAELEIDQSWAVNDSPDRQLLSDTEKLELEAESQQWAEDYGVWHPLTGPAYNTMALDAHEFAFKNQKERARARLACDVYNLLYYFDDLLSNDRGKTLSEADKSAAKSLMVTLLLKLNKKCGSLGKPDLVFASLIRVTSARVELPAAFQGILPAMTDIMNRIDTLADAQWQKKFYSLLVNHLVDANADHDGDDRLTDTEWYVPTRREVAGMPVMLALAELIAGGALNRKALDRELPLLAGNTFSEMLQTLEESVMDIGGIWNDMISAPKEILRDKTVFNIISVHCLKLIEERKFESFEQVLREVIAIYGVGYRQKFDAAYQQLSQYLDHNQARLEPEVFEHVRHYVYALRRIVIGTWDWQHGRGKGRYEANPENGVPEHFFQDFQSLVPALASV